MSNQQTLGPGPQQVLHKAACRGQTDVVAEVLAAGSCVIDARDDMGRTPLLQAAHAGHAAVVGQLLRAGAAVDAADSVGRTPLFAAAEHLT